MDKFIHLSRGHGHITGNRIYWSKIETHVQHAVHKCVKRTCQDNLPHMNEKRSVSGNKY